MPSSMMRPGNFRHDMRGPGVVEISMAEYLRSKKSILKKIRRRLVILGCIIGLTALTSLILGTIVVASYDRIVKFHRVFLKVSLRHLYFVYGGVAMLFSFHGFYIDGHWGKMQKDGNRLVMHLRLYSLLGVASCVAAIWLGYGTLSAFGLVEVRYIVESDINQIYLATLVTLCVHIVVTPWLLRTVHRKAGQADEYFSAEFMHSARQDSSKGSDEQYVESGDEDEQDEKNRRSVVVPALSPRDTNRRTRRSPSKTRHAFYTADGTSAVVATQQQTVRSPRPTDRQKVSTPRISARTLEERDPSPSRHVQSFATPSNDIVADGLSTASVVSDPDHIPFASPVFFTNQSPTIHPTEFWRLWKVSETTGSFSCTFNNKPRVEDVEAHLSSHGFHVVGAEAKDGALQVYFYAVQLGTDTYFLGEFVFLISRQFFQATFKCKDHEAAPEFVARFNLQELHVVDQ